MVNTASLHVVVDSDSDGLRDAGHAADIAKSLAPHLPSSGRRVSANGKVLHIMSLRVAPDVRAYASSQAGKRLPRQILGRLLAAAVKMPSHVTTPTINHGFDRWPIVRIETTSAIIKRLDRQRGEVSRGEYLSMRLITAIENES